MAQQGLLLNISQALVQITHQLGTLMQAEAVRVTVARTKETTEVGEALDSSDSSTPSPERQYKK